jgi:hypothetical protein
MIALFVDLIHLLLREDVILFVLRRIEEKLFPKPVLLAWTIVLTVMKQNVISVFLVILKLIFSV